MCACGSRQLVCAFLGGAFIKLFNALNDMSAELPLVITMVSFNFGVLILYTVLASYQFAQSDVLPQIRLTSTGQVPQLNLEKGELYHLFLSHMHVVPTTLPALGTVADAERVQLLSWSSGQDQMATGKRELLLLLPSVKVRAHPFWRTVDPTFAIPTPVLGRLAGLPRWHATCALTIDPKVAQLICHTHMLGHTAAQSTTLQT